MAGPWVTKDELLPDVKARLAIAQVVATPEMYAVLLDGGAVRRGWQRILQRLGEKGYTPDTIDGWSGRVQYNRDYALAYAFRHAAFAAAFDQAAIDKELEQLDKELESIKLLFGDDGEVLEPTAAYSGGASAGRLTGYDEDLTDVEDW